MNNLTLAHRLQALQSNVFADMDRAKAASREAGNTIIDLSLGSSDLGAAPHVVDAIERSLHDPHTHGYLLHNGTRDFRITAANWYSDRFGVPVDPETEVLPLIGSQEGTAHLPLALLNPGDFALLLDPGYPSHLGGVALAGGQMYGMPILAKNDFLPVLEDIPEAVLAQSKLMVLSYPHNPTTAIAPLAFFQKAVDFCRQHNLVLIHDFPYLDIFFAGTSPPPSILQADRAKTNNALNRIGWPVATPAATMYVWAKIPPSWPGNSVDFCRQLVAQTGVAVSPGSGFGKGGEGYVRFALVHDPDILEAAVEKIGAFLG